MKAPRLVAASILIAFATFGWADTITMKDGRVIAGTYLGGTARQIRVDLGPEVRTFDISEVARIDFSADGATVSTPPPPMMQAPPPPPQPPPQSDPDRPVLRRAPDSTDPSQPVAPPPTSGGDAPTLAQAGSVPAAQPGSIILPQGTSIVVRTIDPIDSQTATQGQSFAASLDQPVELNGQTVIPRGADAVLRLVEAQNSGTFTGRTELALALISVKVNGKYVPVNTQTVTRVSDARGQQTAKVVGGAAAVGAIIGAIAGGGKGAAIGAGAGGAAGAGVQVATKGQRVKVPSETRLTFSLDSSVTI
jgi:hypothetical protein